MEAAMEIVDEMLKKVGARQTIVMMSTGLS